MIWSILQFQPLHGSIQKRVIEYSVIAQFLDVLRLGMFFCIVFIIVQCIDSKSLKGIRASEGRPGQKMNIGGEGGTPSLSLKNRPHIAVCVFACRAWRNIFDEKVTCFPFWCPLDPSNEPHY